ALHSFHPKNLVSSSLALYFAERTRLSACFGKCLELHLRLELPYERGLFVDRYVRAGHCIFCPRADVDGEHANTFVQAFGRGRGEQLTNLSSRSRRTSREANGAAGEDVAGPESQ